MDDIAPTPLDGPAARSVSGEIVAVGRTLALHLEGWQKLGFRFRATASGTVLGQPGWRFRCEEHAVVSLIPLRFENWGVTTVETPLGQFVLPFRGRVRGLRLVAEGQCSLEGASGPFAGWQGTGTYSGLARFRFRVTYRLSCPVEMAALWEAHPTAGGDCGRQGG